MDNHQISYMFDPTYLERRFGVPPLRELLVPDVVGVARIIVMPSFSAESVYTFLYSASDVSIDVRHAEHSLWASERENNWIKPTARIITKIVDDLPAPLNTWQSLKDAALSAPTVEFAIIDGEKFGTLDGVGYRHHLIDADVDLYAELKNPTKEASNHVSQIRIVNAYEQVLKWWE